MRKLTQTVLLLCLILSGVYCHASSVVGMEESKGKDGTPISITEKASHNGSEKISSIDATIDGHYLTVSFTENLGQVAIEITTATGAYVETLSITTPNGLQFYIPNTGDYIVTFTLPNGDEYYGEFTVTD